MIGLIAMTSQNTMRPRRERSISNNRDDESQASSEFLPLDLVLVGRVVKTCGLDGEVKVESLSDVAGRFRVGASFWVVGPCPVRIMVTSVREASGVVYLGCTEWPSSEVASAFRGCYLAIEQSERPVLLDGRYYHDQLIGLRARMETGEPVGVVRAIWSTGPHDVLVLECDGAERLLPAIKDMVVRVDVSAGQMTVRPPKGWIDNDAL